ncbi:exodeoxyribonuclease VII small subunit [Desulfonatronum thioautotrophicum]|uniref:exodeoxyribonuclease VII small subunit n=1 Tax=Desulfonatronum thioautotrophicum TaxID=617001 RepID=UPI0005EB12B5|nr:exodeoxyribonuclease VII small subunit [Desulfonatronum thioautotrophicum]
MCAKTKQPGFDANLSELQRIVSRLENEDLPLETGVGLFKEGVALAQNCRKLLESARNDVMVLSQGLQEPLDPTPNSPADVSENDDESISR